MSSVRLRARKGSLQCARTGRSWLGQITLQCGTGCSYVLLHGRVEVKLMFLFFRRSLEVNGSGSKNLHIVLRFYEMQNWINGAATDLNRTGWYEQVDR